MPDFDAIIVGSGISGGWVAKELCERGLKVCVLERGGDIRPENDYSDHLDPWDKPHFDRVSPTEIQKDYPVQGRIYAFRASNKHFWVKDSEHPYENAPGSEFEWKRGYQVGGRSLMWGRASYRWGPQDFEANKKDGHGVDWPVRYKDIAPWYDKVEQFVGVSGDADDLEQLPGGEHFLPGFELNCADKAFKQKLEAAYPDRRLIIGRVANLRRVSDVHETLGRGQCQARNLCEHGCSYGAYFSSVSATLPAARATGNLTLISNAIVSRVDYDPDSKKVSGVSVIDANTKAATQYTARITFLNASTIATAMLLLASKSETMPNGLANSSDQVGRNLMDHIGGSRIQASVPGLEDRYYSGRRPIGAYIPRYQRDGDFTRGYAFQVYSGRGGASGHSAGIGDAFKRANRTPGGWHIILDAFGEVLPRETNRVTLHKSRTDQWNNPVARIKLELGQNEHNLMSAAHEDALDMLTRAGFKDLNEIREPAGYLKSIKGRTHEMGTARMGRDSKTSVLNGFNQSHQIENLFITDGSFMASSACQNPSLTYMAFSARAANYAADLLQKGTL